MMSTVAVHWFVYKNVVIYVLRAVRISLCPAMRERTILKKHKYLVPLFIKIIVINKYVKTFLSTFWQITRFIFTLSYILQNFRVILLCVSCDLPATRKVCGFLSHTAKLGCSKCKQEFTRGILTLDKHKCSSQTH